MKNYNRISEKISKLSEAQIQTLFEALNNDNQMLCSIIESMTSGIIITDEDWNPILSNNAVERYVPLSMRITDLSSSKKKLFDIIKDKEIALFFKVCHNLNKTNVSEEFTVSTSGGSIRFITITIMPLIFKEKCSGNIIVVRDNTDSKNQEILLHRMESLASLTNLAASVAHEIKNPLGAISIHIQLLQKAIKKAREKDNILPDNKFVENYLDIVNEEIDNLNKIVVDFLFAVRPVNAKLELLHPNQILIKLINFFTPEYEKENITLDVSLSKQDIKLLIDEKLFREVILNISQNAIHAIKENQENIEKGIITITSSINYDKYILTISDNGIGMSEAKLSKIFEPYYTTKANGTGLGLTTVYKIIKEFSGEIDVKSKEKEGTSFIITIPVPQLSKKMLEYN